MGLTVNYDFVFRGGKHALMEKLAALKARFEDLPVKAVSKVVEIERASIKMGYGKYRGARLDQHELGFMMMCNYFEDSAAGKALDKIIDRIGGTVMIEKLTPCERRRYFRLHAEAGEINRRRSDQIKRSGNGLGLRVDVGAGCEYFTVMLGRMGNGNVWHGGRFTKTQYAEHFLDAHLAVIAMLDACKETEILKSVYDEGDYWKSRDVEKLARNINSSTDTLRAISGMLKGPVEKKGFEFHSAVEQSANYVKVRNKRSRRK